MYIRRITTSDHTRHFYFSHDLYWDRIIAEDLMAETYVRKIPANYDEVLFTIPSEYRSPYGE